MFPIYAPWKHRIKRETQARNGIILPLHKYLTLLLLTDTWVYLPIGLYPIINISFPVSSIALQVIKNHFFGLSVIKEILESNLHFFLFKN